MIRGARPERPRVEGYAKIRAEYEAEVAADRLAARKADNPAPEGGGRREAAHRSGGGIRAPDGALGRVVAPRSGRTRRLARTLIARSESAERP